MPDPPGPCVHPDVGAYALGLLEAEERTAYERHLITCAHCLRTLEGLAPLIELLGQVDAATLLAAGPDPGGGTNRGDGPDRRGRSDLRRRPPPHPPGALGALFPRQREPAHDRMRRPHLRAWDKLDDRFRDHRDAAAEREAAEAPWTPAAAEPRPQRTGRRRRDWFHGTTMRRLTLVAAAATVLVMVGFVTIAARSSVTDPRTVAEPPPAPPVVAATTAAPPPSVAPPRRERVAPPPPTRSSSPAAPPRVARTSENPEPTPSEARPDSIKANPGVGAEGNRLAGSDPATGVAAEVRLGRTATGLDVTLTVHGLPGPRDCVLRVIATDGTAHTALRWRMADGEESFTGLGGTALARAEIDHFEVVDAAEAVLVTISSRS
ncbi:zf-HC2 domain-containing protein [Phytohabitans kaempferiae]|uniref:Zf-HC2 domain-containing protein n=1 Tax=Phytohabitans kaempferiae TaxID=1620943 RepID=A0ABV6MDX5_9ACTN